MNKKIKPLDFVQLLQQASEKLCWQTKDTVSLIIVSEIYVIRLCFYFLGWKKNLSIFLTFLFILT